MRTVFALCEVTYSGRGDTFLPLHPRMILIKNDGSVSINGYSKVKPLNYMGPKSTFTEEKENDHLIWAFDSSKENLTIRIHEIFADNYFDLQEEGPGLVRDGTEPQLQKWLSENIEVIDENLVFLEREFNTEAGPVDLLAKDVTTGEFVVIEVKRVAMSSAVYQVSRYLDALDHPNKRAMIVALDVRPKTRVLSDKKSIGWKEVSFPVHCQ